MKRQFFFTSLAVYFIFVALCAGATMDAASVAGKVFDPSGQPVANAHVTLHQSAGAALLSTESGREGEYSFAAIAAGDYLLEASSPGLAIVSPKTVHVNAGESKSVKLTLEISTQRSQVTVTSAAAPQSVDQISKALDVVDVDRAERRGLLSVVDALRFVPGLRVITRGGPGGFSTIQTRGLRAADTAVLIDGFRLRDVTSVQGDASAFLSDLLLVDTSRIEVLRGSGSSLYGTNSVAGTINLITDQGGGPVHGDVDLQGGGLGLIRGLARFSGGAFHDRLTFSGGLAHLNETQGVNNGQAARNWSGQGGITVSVSPSIRIGVRLFADSDYVQLQTIPYPVNTPPTTYIRASAPGTEQLDLANAGLPFNPAGATFVPALNDPDQRRNGRFTSELLKFEHQVTPKLSWRIYYQNALTRRDNIDGPGGAGMLQPVFRTADLYDGRTDTVQARADFIAAPWQVLTAGYEFENERYENWGRDANPDPVLRTYSLTRDSQRSNAVFAQDQLRLLRGRLLVLVSGRYQNFQLDTPSYLGGFSPYAGIHVGSLHDAYTGDASVAYFLHSASTKLRAHAGNSFTQPSVYERFGSYFYGGYYTPYGDPRLSPERAVSVDGGVDQYLWRERLRVSGTFFYTRLQQVIGFDFSGLINPGSDPYGRYGGYFNTGGGIAHGVELSAELRPTRSTSIDASYTYTNALDRISEFATTSGTNPIRRPRILPHTVTVRAVQAIGKRIEIAADFLGGSDILFPLYGFAYQFNGPHQLGLAADYTLPLTDHTSLRFYARVSNALDQLYYEDGFQTPRRWATGGIRFSF